MMRIDERRQLRRIERRLHREDPRLAAAFDSLREPRGRMTIPPLWATAGAVAMGILALALVVTAALLTSTVIGLAAAAAGGAAGWLAAERESLRPIRVPDRPAASRQRP